MPKSLVPIVLVALASGCWLPEPRTVEIRELTLDAAGLDTLRVDVGDGDLAILGDPAIDSIEVRVVLRTSNAVGDRDDAARAALDARLEADGTDGALRVHVDDGFAGYYADVTVALPSALRVAARDGTGDVRVHDVAALDLEDDSGDVEICDVEGEVFVDDASGDLRVERAGSVSVVDDSGELWIVAARGDVVIEDDSGEILVDGAEGDVDVTDASGDIVIRHVAGVVTVRDGSGDIDVSDVGGLEVLEDGSGSVSGP